MWIEPDTYRGRHRPNYETQNESRYFVPQVDCTNAVSMILKATMIAVIVTVCRFLSTPTPWTGLRVVGYESTCDFMFSVLELSIQLR